MTNCVFALKSSCRRAALNPVYKRNLGMTFFLFWRSTSQRPIFWRSKILTPIFWSGPKQLPRLPHPKSTTARYQISFFTLSLLFVVKQNIFDNQFAVFDKTHYFKNDQCKLNNYKLNVTNGGFCDNSKSEIQSRKFKVGNSKSSIQKNQT